MTGPPGFIMLGPPQIMMAWQLTGTSAGVGWAC